MMLNVIGQSNDYAHKHVQERNSPHTIWFIDKTEVSRTPAELIYISRGKKKEDIVWSFPDTLWASSSHTLYNNPRILVLIKY